MSAFIPLIQACISSRFYKIRSMSARCVAAIVPTNSVPRQIVDSFNCMDLSQQNILQGELMGIKHLGEFYSYRSQREPVFCNSKSSGVANVDAILEGMTMKLDMLMKENPNPLTRAAFIDISLALFRHEPKAEALKKNLSEICLRDITQGKSFPIGKQHYLARATSVVLEYIETHSESKEDTKVLIQLLNTQDEEIAHQTLTWLEKSKNAYSSEEMINALQKFTVPPKDKWEGCCATALRVLATYLDTLDSMTQLSVCLAPRERAVLPVHDAWLALSGCAIKMVIP